MEKGKYKNTEFLKTSSLEFETKRDIKAEWFNIFSEEETLQIIKNQQLPSLTEVKVENLSGLFRGSNSGKEEMDQIKRSYSFSLWDVGFYLEHRILKSLENKDGGAIELTRIYSPVFKILNPKKIPKQAVTKGVEVHEYEVDESTPGIQPLNLTLPSEVEELQKVFEDVLKSNGEDSKKYFMADKSLNRIISTMREIYSMLESRKI